MLREYFSDPVFAVTFVIMWVFIVPAVQRWWNNRKNSSGMHKCENCGLWYNEGEVCDRSSCKKRKS